MEVRPGFHMILPPHEHTETNPIKHDGTSVTDIPDLNSVMVATYGRGFDPHWGPQEPTVVLDFVHLATGARRRVILDTGIPSMSLEHIGIPSHGSRRMSFAARAIGQGRVLITYHAWAYFEMVPADGVEDALGPTESRRLVQTPRSPSTPRYMVVIDASDPVPTIGTPVQITGAADALTANLDIQGVMAAGATGVHRLSTSEFVAVVTTWDPGTYYIEKRVHIYDDVYGVRTTVHTLPDAQVRFWLRRFRISGTSISVDTAPLTLGHQMTLRTTSINGNHYPDDADVFNWVDEPTTLTLSVPPREIPFADYTNQWYLNTISGSFFILNWSATGQLTSVRREPIQPLDDHDDDTYNQWSVAPKIRQGLYYGFANRDLAYDQATQWYTKLPSGRHQIYSGRLGQTRPSILSQHPGKMSADSESEVWAESLQAFGMWGYYYTENFWSDPSELMPDYGPVTVGGAWGEVIGMEFRLSGHVVQLPPGPFQAMPVIGGEILSEYDRQYSLSTEQGGLPIYDQMIATRSGYIVASGQISAYRTPALHEAVAISVFRFGGVQELTHGLHRARGHFS